jgi:hypothetical protein
MCANFFIFLISRNWPNFAENTHFKLEKHVSPKKVINFQNNGTKNFTGLNILVFLNLESPCEQTWYLTPLPTRLAE